MGELFTPTHLIVIAVVVLVLFGGKKLPELGKGLGEGLKGFKDGMKGMTDDASKSAETTQTVPPNSTTVISPGETTTTRTGETVVK